jgi:heptosyltransferase-2
MSDKVLIIRLSSFGDIVQCMSALAPLKRGKSGAENREIHWLVKKEFASVLGMSDQVSRVIEFDKKIGMIGLIKLALELRKENYTHIYDAHTNIRSKVVNCILSFFRKVKFARRYKERIKRILLFNFRKNLFPWPFLGAISYLEPIQDWIEFDGRKTNFTQQWKFDEAVLEKFNSFEVSDYIAIAPSAAWEMKRWPLEAWKEVVKKMPDRKFVVLGGPADTFCQEIADIDPTRIINIAGKTSLIESCYFVQKSMATISADTGILHVADILGIKTIALIGPTAFGFPTSPTTETLSVDLDCRPCTKDGRGKCSQDTYQKCMVDITPDMVVEKINTILD